MKTFFFEIPRRLRNISNELDVNAFLFDRAWVVYNDEGVKQILVFLKDGKLIVSTNGIVTYNSWQYIPANHSIIISSTSGGRMFHPAFFDNKILALQLDGTDEKLFMVEESLSESVPMRTLSDIEQYFSLQRAQALNDDEKPTAEVFSPIVEGAQVAFSKNEEDSEENHNLLDMSVVKYGGHSFFALEGKTASYVDEDGRYAFDSYVLVESGIIMKKQYGFTFFYNDDYDESIVYNTEPQIYRFFYGYTLEGLLVGAASQQYVFYDGTKCKWEKCRVVEFYPESGRFVVELYSSKRIIRCNTDKSQAMIDVPNYWDKN